METPIGYRQSKARNCQNHRHPHQQSRDGTEDWQCNHKDDIREEEIVTSDELRVVNIPHLPLRSPSLCDKISRNIPSFYDIFHNLYRHFMTNLVYLHRSFMTIE